jgi:hypothetical protein
MSLNLCFSTKCGHGHVEFPFQTRTDLTLGVLNSANNDERLALIEAEVRSWEWADEEYITSTMADVRALLASPDLELCMI